MRFQAL